MGRRGGSEGSGADSDGTARHVRSVTLSAAHYSARQVLTRRAAAAAHVLTYTPPLSRRYGGVRKELFDIAGCRTPAEQKKETENNTKKKKETFPPVILV